MLEAGGQGHEKAESKFLQWQQGRGWDCHQGMRHGVRELLHRREVLAWSPIPAVLTAGAQESMDRILFPLMNPSSFQKLFLWGHPKLETASTAPKSIFLQGFGSF